jgi:dTDP-4-amino-4,6-dideoxygalactose transaminase
MSSETFIPYARPDIGEEEIRAVTNTLRSGWLTTGPVTFRFEEEFRKSVRAASALAVNSCTAGLHVALSALGIGPGDEVITTPLTFCSTVNVILETGAKPVLADVGRDLNLDPDAIRRAITFRTRAILPVHLAGLPCDMGAVWKIAEEHGLKVIEDAAHAAGAFYKGTPIGGGRSDAVAFSFYATKNLTTGEGGMVTSPDQGLHERMRILCLHGIGRDAWRRYTKEGNWYYEVVERGFKYNMSDIMASIGIQQLRKLERMTARRVEIASVYDRAFGEMAEVELPPRRENCRHCWHLYILRLHLDKLSIDRAQFFSEMHALGIGCSVHFIPIPLHPYYKTLNLADTWARALAEYPRLLSIPLYSKMTDDQVKRVIEAVRTIVVKSRQSTSYFVSSSADQRSLC